MIKLTNVEKYYKSTKALDGINLTIENEGIYYLLGKNGAGKTSLLKLIAGHINASEGLIEVDNHLVDMLHMPYSVHFIESGASQFNMPLRRLFKAAANLNPEFDLAFALEIASQFKLDLNKTYRQLSFGMKVMANTLLGLASNKPVLLLDEPVLGFDAVMRKTFYNLLAESVAKKPKVVILSTHIIDEIATVVEHLIIINNGRIQLCTDIKDFDEKAYAVTGTAECVEAATQGLNVIAKNTVGGFLSASVYDNRIQSSDKYQIQPLSLQDFFISLVGEE